MRNIRLYIYIAFMAVLLSCDKESLQQEGAGDFVSFYVSDKNFADEGTKAIMEDTQTLLALKPTLNVCDLAGINRQDQNPIKGLQVNFNDNYNLWRSNLTWANQEYEFYGYILSPGKVGNNTNGASVSLVNSYQGNLGHCVDLYQPTSYIDDGAAWSDYLLSYRVSVQGKNKPLVRMEMERITSGVELYISTPEGAQAVVESITFSNVSRCMRYTIAEHAISNPNLSGIRHKWVYQNINGASNTKVNYTKSANNSSSWFEVQEKAEENSRFESKFCMMRFITVPQDVTGTLTVVYRVNETNQSDKTKWTQYTASFDLSQTSVTRWELGRKARYYISLDTAVDLEGVIADWVDIDYMEGTFLPM